MASWRLLAAVRYGGRSLENDGPGIAVAFSPDVRSFGKSKGQRGVALDADELNVSVVEFVTPTRLSRQDREVRLNVFLALNFVAVINPVSEVGTAVPGEIAAPIVRVKNNRSSAVLLPPLLVYLQEVVEGIRRQHFRLVMGEASFRTASEAQKENAPRRLPNHDAPTGETESNRPPSPAREIDEPVVVTSQPQGWIEPAGGP